MRFSSVKDKRVARALRHPLHYDSAALKKPRRNPEKINHEKSFFQSESVHKRFVDITGVLRNSTLRLHLGGSYELTAICQVTYSRMI